MFHRSMSLFLPTILQFKRIRKLCEQFSRFDFLARVTVIGFLQDSQVGVTTFLTHSFLILWDQFLYLVPSLTFKSLPLYTTLELRNLRLEYWNVIMYLYTLYIYLWIFNGTNLLKLQFATIKSYPIVIQITQHASDRRPSYLKTNFHFFLLYFWSNLFTFLFSIIHVHVHIFFFHILSIFRLIICTLNEFFVH